jgi:hypothetical protein
MRSPLRHGFDPPPNHTASAPTRAAVLLGALSLAPTRPVATVRHPGRYTIVRESVFEHKEAEEQSTFRAGEFVAEHLAPLMPNAPQVTAGEVEAYEAK